MSKIIKQNNTQKPIKLQPNMDAHTAALSLYRVVRHTVLCVFELGVVVVIVIVGTHRRRYIREYKSLTKPLEYTGFMCIAHELIGHRIAMAVCSFTPYTPIHTTDANEP